MKLYHQTEHGSLYLGDCLEVMKEMADKSVDCCITSPPYWGLRDYGHDDQLGLEKSPEEYVANMVQLFREVRRVLKADGVLWLNLGDSYAGSGVHQEHHANAGISQAAKRGCTNGVPVPSGLKPKDLVGIPWRVAFALQADGWWLRQDIIWHKPNPMPESVKDRCTKSHEYMFLMSKSAKYYFDYEAIQEPASGYDGRNKTTNDGSAKYKDMVVPNGSANSCYGVTTERWKFKNLQPKGQQPNTMHLNRLVGDDVLTAVRNKRSVWTVTTKPYKEAHFATYPPDLILPCVLASKANAIILDPFFGSGTTGIVAVQNCRKYVGIELNEKYCEIAAKRIEQELDQTDIFRSDL